MKTDEQQEIIDISPVIDEPFTSEDQLEQQPLLLSSTKPSINKEYIGLIMAALSAVMFSVMSAGVKSAAARNYPFSQIVFFRSIFQMTLAALTAAYVKVCPFGVGINRWYLIARGASGAIGLALYFYTLTHMNLGDVDFFMFLTFK